MTNEPQYPAAIDPDKVGEYPARSGAGGGYVWDAVLEYRVWCSPRDGAPDEAEGSDYYYAFSNYPEALRFSQEHAGADAPLALILQNEYIEELEPGQYQHVKQSRVTEWPVEFLSRPQRDTFTIPDFLSPSAPPNRLDILRGLAPNPRHKI